MPTGKYWFRSYYTNRVTGFTKPNLSEIIQISDETSWRRKPARLVGASGRHCTLAELMRDNETYDLQGPLDCPFIKGSKPTYDRLLLELEGLVAAFIDDSPKETRSYEADENIQSALNLIEKAK